MRKGTPWRLQHTLRMVRIKGTRSGIMRVVPRPIAPPSEVVVRDAQQEIHRGPAFVSTLTTVDHAANTSKSIHHFPRNFCAQSSRARFDRARAREKENAHGPSITTSDLDEPERAARSAREVYHALPGTGVIHCKTSERCNPTRSLGHRRYFPE